ncbi:MAG: hypothetical protein HOY71_23315, partial [Nonomuraea sp.]|nr:hypothetical protein [Nonomuraea sp.]
MGYRVAAMLRITQATSPAPGAVNEDYVLSGPGWVAVLDGATAPRGVESGCVHGVPWLVRRLSWAIGARIGEALPLREVLAAAISDTRAAHGGLCDLGNPNSPSSTVALLRERGELLDYLVLCDSPVL